jgi:hypothetical protein
MNSFTPLSIVIKQKQSQHNLHVTKIMVASWCIFKTMVLYWFNTLFVGNIIHKKLSSFDFRKNVLTSCFHNVDQFANFWIFLDYYKSKHTSFATYNFDLPNIVLFFKKVCTISSVYGGSYNLHQSWIYVGSCNLHQLMIMIIVKLSLLFLTLWKTLTLLALNVSSFDVIVS